MIVAHLSERAAHVEETPVAASTEAAAPAAEGADAEKKES